MSLSGAFFGVVLLAALSGAAPEAACRSFEPQLERLEEDLSARRLAAVRQGIEALQLSLSTVDCPDIELQRQLIHGNLLLDEGRLTEADEVLQSLQPIETTSLPLRGRFLYLVGSLAYELGQPRRARRHYEDLLEIDLVLGNPRHIASDRFLITATKINGSVGEEHRVPITQELRQILDDTAQDDEVFQVPALHIALGRLEDGDSGRRSLDLGLSLAQVPEDQVLALGALAVDRLRQGPTEYEAAAALLDQALAHAHRALEEEGNPWPLLHSLTDRQVVRWATLPPAEALADSIQALETIEAVRRHQHQKSARAGFFSVWAEAYQQLAGRLLTAEPPDVHQAFLVMERYRARVLYDALMPIPDTSDLETPTVPSVVDIHRIRRRLADNEAMLIFQVAPVKDLFGRFAGGAWVLAIHRHGVQVYELPDQGLLQHKIETYLGLLREDHDLEPQAASILYRDVLGSALEDLPGKVDRLILAPAGKLHLLPFGALRRAPDAAPLAFEYQLSSVPSATLWMHWRTSAPPPLPAAALVLANPRPGPIPGTPLRSPLGSLPFAEKEGRQVVETLRRGSRLRLGSEADEASLKHLDLGPFGLIHFAAHAVMDTVHPDRSALLLAPGQGEDGELRATEIEALDLEDRMVVLAACQSASGRVLRGEGVLHLANPFFQAGAATVVGSLWPLDDRQAQWFFTTFYKHLENGTSVQRALQRAQNDLSQTDVPLAAWSGMVVLGDGSRVLIPAEPPLWQRREGISLAALGLILLGLSGLVIQRHLGTSQTSSSSGK